MLKTPPRFAAILMLLTALPLTAHAQTPTLPATAYLIPPHTAPEGEGYFAIIEGHDNKLYIGTHANAVNSYLVAFDPASETMTTVVDAHAAIGINTTTGFAAQAKIHTRNNVGLSGAIYFATKQGYPDKGESRLAYPGGYPMAYNPITAQTTVYPIAHPHQGIISITPDESRSLFYISTTSDTRPIEHSRFMVYDMKAETYTDLIDSEHLFAFIVVDNQGRAYHPIRGGDIARYNPDTQTLTRLTQTIDGQPPTPDSHLADPYSHPINWDISPDRRTLYAVPMNGNRLYAYDLTGGGDTLKGRTVGTLLPGKEKVDCRALCVGPTGTVWATVTYTNKALRGRVPHLIRYMPGPGGDAAPVDLGIITLANPDYTPMTDAAGKPLPYHRPLLDLGDGSLVNRNVTLGICQTKDANVYILALQPYTLLKITPPATPPKP